MNMTRPIVVPFMLTDYYCGRSVFSKPLFSQPTAVPRTAV
eukprot:COSAG06_NODE_42897_length_377_cov_0.895683_2_plen_39_part_01